MLRFLLCTDKVVISRLCCFGRIVRAVQNFRASISTNTAINKSLRRSLYNDPKFERRSPVRSAERDSSWLDRPHSGNWVRGPNHRQGQDVRDIEQSTRINSRYKLLKRERATRNPSKTLKAFAKDSVEDRSSTSETLRDARYDYKMKVGGNRAARRAVQFGHKLQPRPSSRSAPRSAQRYTSQRNNVLSPPNQGLRSSTLDKNTYTEGDDGISLPEELRNERPPRSREPSFTMGRRASGDTRPSGNRAPGFYGRDGREGPRRDDETTNHRQTDVPLSMPYTTPASEFLYGTSVVVAALLSSRRKLYKLYIYDGDNREVHDQDIKVRNLASDRSVPVERVRGDWLRVLDKMSGGRPHNGYVLEASPLPKLPVIGLRPVLGPKAPFHVILDHQSREDEDINGNNTNVKYEVGFSRFPFVLLLDGILDPGNLGAIMRTAFFLGVDVVAVANRSSAPVSPVALKASAGASETLPLVSVDQPGSFLDTCKKNGWMIYAAASPGSSKRSNRNQYLSVAALQRPLKKHPCVLVLGGEGDGLRPDIQRKASFDVGIEGQRVGQGKVDSLNVSVAAGLLCEAFLRKPSEGEDVVVETSTVVPRSDNSRGDISNILF